MKVTKIISRGYREELEDLTPKFYNILLKSFNSFWHTVCILQIENQVLSEVMT